MLVEGRDGYVLKEVHGFLKMIGLFAHLTWIFPLFKRIPGLNASMVRY
jgi:cytochrome P450 family 628